MIKFSAAAPGAGMGAGLGGATGAGFGQPSPIQKQTSPGPDQASSAQDFPTLAGFGSGAGGSSAAAGVPASAIDWLQGLGFIGTGSTADQGLSEELDSEQTAAPAEAQALPSTDSATLAVAAMDEAAPLLGFGGMSGATTAAADPAASRDFPGPQALISGSLERAARINLSGEAPQPAPTVSAAVAAAPQSQLPQSTLGGMAGSIALRPPTDAAVLLQSSQPGQAENPLLAPGSVRAGVAPVPEWSPVRVDPQQAHWGRDLMAALAERVEMQLSQQIKQARIRLDPPDMGRLQLTVRMDGDRLSVQLNASHPQVREALAQQQDRLRADLAGEYGQGVDVSVGQEQSRQRSTAGDGHWPGAETGLIAADGLFDESLGAPAAPDGNRDWVSTLV